jgi:cell division protein FtsA
MAVPSSYVASLDVGHSRVLALIAELAQGGRLVIRGVGVAPLAEGLEGGHIVNLKKVVEAIREAVQEAETLAKVLMERAWVSVGSVSVVGRLTTTALHIGSKARPILPKDLARLWEAVRWQNLPAGHQVLNVLPHDFTLDDQEHLLNPEGMEGTRLSMNALVLSCKEGPVRTLEKAINEAGVEVEGFLFAPVAASLAVLTPEERRLGALLVDLGHKTTSYALWQQDQVLAAGAIPLGSSMVEQDLVQFFTTTFPAALEAKRSKITLLLDTVDEEEAVMLPTLAGERRFVSRREACRVAAARVVELLQMVGLNFTRQLPREVRLLSAVLCGGGSHLEGIETHGAAVFGCPARLGDPAFFEDATGCLTQPPFSLRSAACGIGLLHYGSQTAHGSLGGVSTQTLQQKPGFWQRLFGRWKKEGSHDHL